MARRNSKDQSHTPSSALTGISLFSGAMGLDLGLERAGIETRVCVEVEKQFCETISLNRPELPVICDDIRNVSTQQILDAAGLKAGEVFCVSGGPPCQSFSSGGKRGSILDPRGSLFMEFVRVIREVQPRFFVFENVAQIVTAAIKHRPIKDRPGQDWNLSAYSKNGGLGRGDDDSDAEALTDDEMSGAAISAVLEEFEQLGYFLKFNVLNAADFGVPQRRLRFVLIGSRDTSNFEMPVPTHCSDPDDGLLPWVTLRDALLGLREKEPLHSNYGEDFTRIFNMIPPGANWRALPPEVAREALGNAYESGGGKTGFFRRLAWDEPSPTIVGKPNRKSSAICHPDFTRPLTVRESARIQGFPDDWKFAGGMHTQYLQIGNAAPVGLGFAIGQALVNAAHGCPKGKASKSTHKHDDHSFMLENARRVLRASARNKVSRKAAQAKQLSLL